MITITPLTSRDDERGSSFAFPLADAFNEAHVTTCVPGATRGNHFHTETHEVMVVFHRDRWLLRWDGGERRFEGSGAVLLDIAPPLAHAVINDGAAELLLFVLHRAPERGGSKDTFRREPE